VRTTESSDESRGSRGRKDLEADLRGIHIGRVLDVATGEGGFARLLADHLGSFEEIVGIDVIPPSDSPESVFRRDRVRFVEMDVEALSLADESFDAVAVSSSLHHFPDPLKVLGEMRRVLRPGGYFFVRETHHDVESEPERTDMLLHHWVAKIDRLLDSHHAVTYSRDEILVLTERLRLTDVRVYDARNNDSDPFDSDAVQSTFRTVDHYLRAASGFPDLPELQEGARELRHRLRDVGIQWEPEVFVMGRKP
jgi:SAM-dependent methyltransferase